MDALSEILRVVKLRGALFFNAELSAPWCLTEPSAQEIAPNLHLASGHVILYHFVIEGRAFARTPDGLQENLSPGDVVIIPHGDVHLLGNGWPEKPVNALKAFAGNLKDGLKLVRFGGGGEVTKLICGYMVVDQELADVFLAGLPKLIKVGVSDEPSGQWLKNSIRYSVGDDGGSGSGSDIVIAKLSEVLFVETLRRYITSLPENDTGWLAGARDPVVGKTLALMHAKPDTDWTVENLARNVGMSRTRLADRFHHFLADSPMAYLKRWRLKLGAEMLESTLNSISDIAAAVGYGSEAAFNRAFKQEYEIPPAKYRRLRRD